jgi:hypothetical protein
LEACYAKKNCKDIATICKLFAVIDEKGYCCRTVEESKAKLSQKDVNDEASDVPRINFAKGLQVHSSTSSMTFTTTSLVDNGKIGLLSDKNMIVVAKVKDENVKMDVGCSVQCYFWKAVCIKPFSLLLDVIMAVCCVPNLIT